MKPAPIDREAADLFTLTIGMRAWAETGLPGRAPTAHDLRNTCASRAAAAGLDLVQMMAMFSWQSPATAARYLHLYGGRLEDMARKLGRA